MSAMKFREPNQVLWRGVRPGHNGVQIAKSIYVTEDTAIIHTVNDDVTLYLISMSLVVFAAIGQGYIYIRNIADTEQYRPLLLNVHTLVGPSPSDHLYFYPPLEIPTGYDVCLVNDTASSYSRGFIFGWEE